VSELETNLPPALQAQRVIVVHADLAERQEIGASKHGVRYVVPILGGRFEGPEALAGEVLPGGADWQLLRADGVLEIDARYSLRAQDGALIHVRNRGIVVRPLASEPLYVRSVPELEVASTSAHAWLNRVIFLGTLQLLSRHKVCVAIYRVT